MKAAKKPAARRKAAKAAKPRLLSGGNPQIAKGYGDAPVQAYIEAMPGWKRDVGRRLDEDPGWFLSFHCFTKYIKVTFFRGAALRPRPPGESKHKDVRYLDIHEDDPLDAAHLAAWIKQASRLPGERM